MIVIEPVIEFEDENVKEEPQKSNKRVKREPKPRRRTKKNPRYKIEEGIWFEPEEFIKHIQFKECLEFPFWNDFQTEKKKYFPDDIKEEEMEIEAFDYDDDFENDPSFTISSDLENRQFDEDELEDFTVDDSDLDEPRDTPRKRRRKVQEHETYKSFK